MKKVLSLLLCALLLCACLPAAMAEEKKLTDASRNFVYVLRDDGSAELLEYKGPAGRVIIPNALDGHPLTAVRRNPFYFLDVNTYRQKTCTVAVAQDHPYLATINGVLFGKTDRKLISYPITLDAPEYQIPDGIEIIGDYAFYDVSCLSFVSIPDSVTSIGEGAFYKCSGLTSVSIPDGVTSIEGNAFQLCYGLTSVVIPDGVTSIEEGTFKECSSLASVVIPASVTEIVSYAFSGCSPDLVIIVTAGSYAEQYCMKYSLAYQADGVDYSDAPTDWLNH